MDGKKLTSRCTLGTKVRWSDSENKKEKTSKRKEASCGLLGETEKNGVWEGRSGLLRQLEWSTLRRGGVRKPGEVRERQGKFAKPALKEQELARKKAESMIKKFLMDLKCSVSR